MNFLLDTNLVFEWVKPRPNPGVVAWMADVDEDRTFVSVITITELRFGVEKMATGGRKQWLHSVAGG
jgi:toxin FitB